MTMRNRPTVAQQIDNLHFVKVVDMMLLEGTPGADVARFIHDDQKALLDVSLKSLTNGLNERKKALRETAIENSKEQTKEWFRKHEVKGEPVPEIPKVTAPAEAAADEGYEADEEDDATPPLDGPFNRAEEARERTVGSFAKKIYDRRLKGLDELVELEALARTQRERIDRLVRIEFEKDGYLDGIAKEMSVFSDTLMKRVAVKDKLGLIDGDQKFREQLDLKGYTAKTSEVLTNPESRHRIVSLIDRVRRIEEKRKAKSDAKAAGG